jgi:hypothetical protein
MSRAGFERVYEERGLEDYKLQTLDDLFYIYGVRLNHVEGYSKLEEMDRIIFNNFVINYFNCNGLESRNISILKVIKANKNIRVEFVKNGEWKLAIIQVSTRS